jgi:hypothetical protein
MRILGCSCLLAVLLLELPTEAAEPPAPNAFLDQPVPESLIPLSANPKLPKTEAPFLQFNSFEERMENLQSVAQRPIVYPDGLVKFIQSGDRTSDWDKGKVLFLRERDGSPAGNTVRNYLTPFLEAMTLTWKYDSARDAVVTDFKWHRDDSRTSGQLLDVLLHAQPSATKPLHLQLIDLYFRAVDSHTQTAWFDPFWKYYFDHHELDPDDSWRIAFDALLSKPENFPQVWKLRFVDDVRHHFMPSFVTNLLAATMRDEKGDEHVIIVNDEPEMMSPGEGYVSYYVFDPSGKFERGGVLNSGHRSENTCAWIDTGGTDLTIRTFFNGSSPIDTLYVLTDHGLAIKQLQDSSSIGLGCGRVVYSTSP